MHTSTVTLDFDDLRVEPKHRWFHFHLVSASEVVGSGNILALDEARAASSATVTLAGLNDVVVLPVGACDE